MGLPGFEPESIEPKNIDWSSFKNYLENKYAKGYAISIFEHSRKYYNLLNKVNGIQFAKPTCRNNIINSLIALSRFLGIYEEFKKDLEIHGIKRYKPDPIQAFSRIYNCDAHAGLNHWFKEAMAVLSPNEKLCLRFLMLSGTRAMEGINSFNLIVKVKESYKKQYFNENTNCLEHFKYPNLFLRNSKNCYISCLPKALLEEISKSTIVSYTTIDKQLNKANLPMRIKHLRSYYATKMREMGLLSEQIDLLQGRVGKSIFMQHYFKQNPRGLSEKVLALLPNFEYSFMNPQNLDIANA